LNSKGKWSWGSIRAGHSAARGVVVDDQRPVSVDRIVGGHAENGNGSLAGWRAILSCTGRRISRDNLSALAAAAAFYSFLSLFPSLTAAVSLYGLVVDPTMVERQVNTLSGLLPPEAVTLMATWLQTLVQGPPSRFGIGLLVSLLLAFWSAWSATGMLMTAVNVCYGLEEKRRFVRFNLDAIWLTAGLALFGFAALGLLAVLPVVLGLLPVSDAIREVIGLVRWPTLGGFAILALAIVYHYAPDRVALRWQWVSWGATAATALWLAGSVVFTIYVSEVGSYDKTYGSLGAVIILLLWFYWTTYVILVGAELNAEIERCRGYPGASLLARSGTRT
jgi:membrane protein